MSMKTVDTRLITNIDRWKIHNCDRSWWEIYDFAPPFVINSRGLLVHRPKSLGLHCVHEDFGGSRHEHCEYWCGNSSNDTGNLTYLNDVESHLVLCTKCEASAVAAGRRRAEEIVGRHVHIGGIRAVAHCCDHSYEVRK